MIEESATIAATTAIINKIRLVVLILALILAFIVFLLLYNSAERLLFSFIIPHTHKKFKFTLLLSWLLRLLEIYLNHWKLKKEACF